MGRVHAPTSNERFFVRARFAAVATTALVSLGCSGAVGSEEIDVRDDAILNGTAISEANSGVVELLSGVPGGKIGCTGTLLKNNWVLTAAHCVNLHLDRDYASAYEGMQTGSGITNIGDSLVDTSGRYVIAGRAILNGNSVFYLKRFLPDGRTDFQFGNQGETFFDVASLTGEAINAITLQTDGKIVATGTGMAGSSVQIATARFDVNGNFDPGFGVFGVLQTDISPSTMEAAADVTMDLQGRVLVAGRSDTGTFGQNRYTVIRLLSNGWPDLGFGSFGVLQVQPGGVPSSYAYGVAVDGNGKIVLTGHAPSSGSLSTTAVVRINDNGTPDNGFDGDGTLFLPNSNGGSKVLIQGTRILIGGYTKDTTAAVWRLTSTGAVDGTFGTNGVSKPKFFDEMYSTVIGMVFASDGRIRVGVSVNTKSSGAQYGYAALTANGGLTADRVFPEVQGLAVGIGPGKLSPSTIAASGNRVFLAGSVDATSSTTGHTNFIVLQPDRTFDDTFQTAVSETVDGETLGADQVYLSPSNDDVALLHFPTGILMNNSRTGYTFPGFFTNFGSLLSTNVTCKGYGNSAIDANGNQTGSGTLRTGTSRVTSVGDPYVKLGYLASPATPQIPLKGDSGGSCSSGNLIVGVNSRGDGTSLLEIRASRFATWANQRIQ